MEARELSRAGFSPATLWTQESGLQRTASTRRRSVHSFSYVLGSSLLWFGSKRSPQVHVSEHCPQLVALLGGGVKESLGGEA